MKCKKCGSDIKPGSKFCEECGAPVPVKADNAKEKPAKTKPSKTDESKQVKAQPVQVQQAPDIGAAPKAPQILFSDPDYSRPPYAGRGKVRQGVPVPGYSDRVNDPEIMKAVNKRRKLGIIFSCVLIPLPFAGFMIYCLASKQMDIGQAAMIGGIISGVFLLFALFSMIKSGLKKPYEGVVTDMKSHLSYKHRNQDDEVCYTEYITYVQTTDGKKKKIKEREGAAVDAYYYLEIGDRFLYHPKFSFPYEVYDKSKKDHIYCVACRRKNNAQNDRCDKCHIPLLK